MINIVDKGGDFEVCPEGNFVGRVTEVIFLGTVSEEYKGVTKSSPKIKIGFELSKLMEDGRPFVMSTFPITASMNKKASFRKLVQGIMPLTPDMEKAFDAEQLIGKTTLVNVFHKAGKDGAVFANIAGCSPVPEGMPIPAAVNTPFIFDVTTSPLEHLEKLPDFTREMIVKTPEYKLRSGESVFG